jgi:RNA polymerase sigma factor (TIGR02999 family)
MEPLPPVPSDDVTALLRAWGRGDAQAAEKLAGLVYAELRRTAARHLRRERREHSLAPTALVHEAYLRLVGQRRAVWKNRAQFYAVAARTMRRILVDHARQRRASKRGGSWLRISFAETVAAGDPPDLDLLALDDALAELAAIDADKARMVELRFFVGLSLEETARAMDVSVATLTREWRTARAWLFRRLRG